VTERPQRHERMLHSGEGGEHVFEDRPTIGMIQGVRLRCLMTEIGNFHYSQDCGVLADAALMNLTSQPLPDIFTTGPARGDLTARCGMGVYGLRRRRSLEQPCSQEGRDRNTPALASGRDGPVFSHSPALHSPSHTPCEQTRSEAEAGIRSETM
jgi:hypothetical protein